MKRKNLLSFLLTILFVVFALHGVHTYAQTSISGDDVCGGINDPCKISDLKTISQGIFRVMITLGLPLLVVFIIYRFVVAWYALAQGNANAYKEAGKKVTQAIIGFIIILGLFGGIYLAMLKYIGVNSDYTNLLEKISLIDIPHAYAAGGVCAPPQKGDTCIFTAKGQTRPGIITDADSWVDLSLFCKDSTGLTSNTDFVNNTNYWRGQTDCQGKANGTVCNFVSGKENKMGICSSAYTPPDTHFKTGPADCIGKLPDTFCVPSSFTFGVKGGTCVSRNTANISEATCYPIGAGNRCLSPYNEGKVGTTDIGGTPCLVVDDPCTQSNGKPGIFAQKQRGIFCVDPSTLTTDTSVSNPTPAQSPAPSPSMQDSSEAQANTQLPNPLGFTSVYDFILGALSLLMKFFLYPALVGIWVYSGFLYVAAQGAPDKLKKAHNLLLWAFISTIVVFATQGFLIALQNSVNNILPTA